MGKISRYICLFFALFCISANSFAIKLEKKKIRDVENYCYVIMPNDEIYGLAEKLGITTEDIIKYNNWVKDGFIPERKLYFPVKEFAPVFESLDNVEIVKDDVMPRQQPGDDISEFIYNKPKRDEPWHVPVEERELNVIVCQPFMLGQSKLNNISQSATDFYRGFLLGIDSLRAVYDYPQMRIIAIDCGNDVTVPLSRYAEAFKKADIIVAPENQSQLTLLENFGRENNVFVLNILQARDDDYLNNPFAMQGNIPTDMMYDKAIQWFIANLKGVTPVIIDNRNGSRDKQAFVTRLTDQLKLKGIPYKTITYSGTLAWNTLVQGLGQVSSDMIFVPTSGSVSDFQKSFATLLKLKNTLAEQNAGYDIHLFGYPEYMTFSSGEYNNLRKLGASFYTRFFHDAQSKESKNFQNSYYNRYGVSIPGGMPNQAVFGFDVARYLIALASKNVLSSEIIEDLEPVEGLQTSYNFRNTTGNKGGLLNENLYIITLTAKSAPKVTTL